MPRHPPGLRHGLLLERLLWQYHGPLWLFISPARPSVRMLRQLLVAVSRIACVFRAACSFWNDASKSSFGLGASSSPNPVMRMGGISRGDGGEAARRERYSESVSPRSSSRSSRTSPLLGAAELER